MITSETMYSEITWSFLLECTEAKFIMAAETSYLHT